MFHKNIKKKRIFMDVYIYYLCHMKTCALGENTGIYILERNIHINIHILKTSSYCVYVW